MSFAFAYWRTVRIIGRPYGEVQLFAIGQAYQREVPPEIARPLR